MSDLISRQAAIDILEGHLDDDYLDGYEYLNELKAIPSAQPELKYTKEELDVFRHGISLSLLSKRSSQHWRYDEDMSKEIEYLEKLYKKVVADMRGEQGETG